VGSEFKDSLSIVPIEALAMIHEENDKIVADL
jgi:hypothetical protein